MNRVNKKLLTLTLSTIMLQSCSTSKVEDTSKVEIEKAPITATNGSLPPYLSRDIKDEVFYFVMPDRSQCQH